MLQKLACLAVVAGGLHSGAAFAQFAPVRSDDGLPRAAGFESPHASLGAVTAQTLSLTHAAGLSDETFGLSDSERFQLRQQIRDAAEDIYASPSRKPSLPRDRAVPVRR
ncbi:hypothetical protein IMZ29_04745 [Achromobacter sp. GG226]|uniref:hypothetical protein n=1 Tax=Verticiella alkaliphila TaxID=2779529 RepID=UPI001C0CB32E|nr:hypothetical protein [Verticiella sp. GG226]MBU4609876.1 hypothetical protein [Verticiella sp. GG226]